MQRRTLCGGGLRAAAAFLVLGAAAALAGQDELELTTSLAGRTLSFDWPALRIGTAEYPAGPTGVTVFHFPRRALAAVDVRGGGPGTVNTDYLRLGYEQPELDAVVFSGGSWYGLESTTAVASALKDAGIRDGNWVNLALAVGAIVYDFGERRLNEIYPDKRLAQAALRAARPGSFPLGAAGAGRFARTGGLFGCNAYSGQGAAFRRIGELRIAAFTVVNALGLVVRRDGRVAACYREAGWPEELHASELLAAYPIRRTAGGEGDRNTTVSLVVTNRKLGFAELQRLAVQVHTSMARAIQPFATEADGDVLYAVSTGELEVQDDERALSPVEIGVVASELMWDAVLSAVPAQPAVPQPREGPAVDPRQLRRYAGEYVFGPAARLAVTAEAGRLYARAAGPRDVYGIGREAAVELQPLAAASEFAVPGRYPLVLRFDAPDGLTINPGHWSQTGRRARSGP